MGESAVSYIRRLARANHLRPNYLRRCLRDPDHGGIRLGWLAAMAGRPVDSLERALSDAGQRQTPSGPARRGRGKRDKAALLATLRQDAFDRGMSIRAISDRRGVSRRIVLQALESPTPRPRKKLPLRTSRLDPFKDAIDEILRQDRGNPHQRRRTVKNIMDTLTTEHGMTGVSYSMVRGHVASRRSITPRPQPAMTDSVSANWFFRTAHRGQTMPWSSAHHAVEHEDLPLLRDLLNTGHDVEDDNGDGWTLLRHAVDVEYDRHVQTGEPLHADVTTFLLARGADPLRHCNGTSVVEEAETRGHWLAAEIMHAWTNRGHNHAQPCTVASARSDKTATRPD
jgi:uncharacterized protein